MGAAPTWPSTMHNYQVGRCFKRGTYMMCGGPVPDETLQMFRRSHPRANGVAKPELAMYSLRVEVGLLCCWPRGLQWPQRFGYRASVPESSTGGPAKSNPMAQNPPNSRKSGCKAQPMIRKCLAATPQTYSGESMQIAVRAGRVKELKMSRSTVRLQNTSRSRGAWTGLASLPRSASPFRGLCCD